MGSSETSDETGVRLRRDNSKKKMKEKKRKGKKLHFVNEIYMSIDATQPFYGAIHTDQHVVKTELAHCP